MAKKKVVQKKKRRPQRRRVPKANAGITPEKIAAWKEANKDTKFKEGNSFWTTRSKHGREAIFTDPWKMWDAFLEYVSFCEANPWMRVDYKATKFGLVKVEIPTAMPLTMGGFASFCGVWEAYFNDFQTKKVYQSNPEFAPIINEIKNSIRNQSVGGAIVGTYNANIISRMYGMAETVNTNVNDQRKATADLFPKRLKNERK
jgi:hypothetical protein